MRRPPSTSSGKAAIAVTDEAPTDHRPPARAGGIWSRSGRSLPRANIEKKARRSSRSNAETCHTIDKGGVNKVGPNQWDIVGGKRASHESNT